MSRAAFLLLALAAPAAPALAQHIAVEEFVLDNGMTFLLLPRDEQPNAIAAGWVAMVGSANERPGITGISHFFEHMMFKGTPTIGTNDAAADADFRARQDAVKSRINELIWGGQYDRFRRGEIGDPWDAANDTDEIRSLRAQLRELMESHKSVIVDNEYDRIYANEGGSGINAFTSNDLTFYFLAVPANKFELWAWMESDRLHASVFREFHSERDVVHEERRLSVESTPTGVFEEQFDAMFWQASPYSWPVIGWPSDLNSYTLEQAQRYFDTYYQPANLVGIIVGDFDAAAVKPVIERYFGRLEPGDAPAPPVVTLEVPQLAEQRMIAECDCQPQVEVRYHTVPFGHADSAALEMMAEVLNGRTGRLYKALVETRGIATSAAASAGGLGRPAKHAGSFSFTAEAKGPADPQELEQAWYEELARLQQEDVPERELQKVRNRVAADAFRGLQSNFFLMLQIGYYEALGGWEQINERPRKLQAVTAADIRRIAGTYFQPSQRNVAIYRRKAGAPAVEDEFLALHPVQRQQAAAMLKQIENYSLPGLQAARAQLAGMIDRIPAEQVENVRPMIDFLLKKMDERIAELQAREGAPAPPDAPDAPDAPDDAGRRRTTPDDDLVTPKINMNSSTVVPFTLSLLIAAAPLAAQEIPARPEDITFAPLQFEPPRAGEYRQELSGGVPVYLAPSRELPLVNVVFTFKGGQYLDPPAQVGLASAAAAMVRRGGTATISAEDLDERFDFLAANVSVGAGPTTTTASLNCLASNLDESLDLFMDMLRNPGFQPGRHAIYIDEQLEAIRQRNDAPGSILRREWNALIYGSEHFEGRLTTRPMLQSITAGDLRAMHGRIFHPGNLVIAVSGDFEPRDMFQRLQRAIAGWPMQPRVEDPPAPTAAPVPGVFHVEKEVPQGTVVIGCRAVPRDHPDYFALLLANDILGGGGFTSRITDRVRNDEGLAYSAGSRFSPRVHYPGEFAASVQSKNRTVALSIRIVLEEIARLRAEPVTEAELATARSSFIESLPRTFESKAGMLAVFVDDELTGRDPGYWADYRDRIRAVTAADIQRVANAWLDPASMTIVIVGPWAPIAAGDLEGRASMADIVGGAVTHLPLRDPFTLDPLPAPAP